jgi:hypothetical protein
MEEGESFSIPEVSEVRYRQLMGKEEQRFVVKYCWMKG